LSNSEHSHGPGATNLAISVFRNIMIINRIVGHKLYSEQHGVVFQQFGLTEDEEAK